MSEILDKAVIRGTGFNPNGGGFAELIINGRVYPADQVAAAMMHYELPVDDTAEFHRLKALIWKRESTQEWVLELSGSINDTFFINKHTQPLDIAPEDVAGLPTLYMEPATEDASSREMISSLVELVKRQDTLLQKLGNYIADNDERNVKVIDHVRDILQKQLNASEGEHYKLAAYIDEITELDVAVAKAIADAAEKYNEFQMNETTVELPEILEAFDDLASATTNDHAQGFVESDIDGCCGCSCSTNTEEGDDAEAEFQRSDEGQHTAVFTDDLETALLEHLSHDVDFPVIEHADNVQILRPNTTATTTSDYLADISLDDIAAMLPEESLGKFNRMMSEAEQQSWLDYVNSERAAYKARYGIDPKNIDGWLPRKTVDTWLIEFRGITVNTRSYS